MAHTIISATNEDTVIIKNIVFNVLKEYGLKHDEAGKDADLNNIEANYFQSNGFFGLVIDRETNKTVGTFGIFRLSNEVCELRKMYLLKEARGKGCGMMILNFVIDMARRKNYKKITLETIGVLKEAIGLYKKYGFKEIKPEKISNRVDQAFELMIED